MKPELYRRIAGQKLRLLAVVAGTVVWLVFLQRNLVLEESIGYTIQAIGFAALIVLVLEYSGGIRGARLYRAVAWIGVYSYGIYLWHSVALAPGDVFIRKASTFGIPVMVAWGLALALQFAVAIIAGYAATRAIEFPFLRIRDALFPARRRGTPAAQPAEQHAA